MRVTLFDGVLRSFRRVFSGGRMHQLHTRREIDALMERERARCDRNGHEFSLVLFRVAQARSESPRSKAAEQSDTTRLSQILQRRSRAFDHIGRFDENTVCAMLPDTDAVGAGAFSRSVGDLFVEGLDANTVQRPTWTLFTYPTNWSGDDDGQSGDSGRPERRDRRHKKLASDVPAVHSESMRIGPDVLSNAVHQPRFPVGSVQGLLARPLPVWKRAIDIGGALVGLVLASPVLVISAVAIKLTSPGPIIYRQRRCGLGGKPFGIWKFRTMINNADANKAELMKLNEQDGPAFKLKNDPRVTRVGRFLRKTSIDELPQLVNVLRGEMSLVGPRPLPIKEQAAGEQWHQRRLDVTPGLTCIWQIRGRSKVSFNEWVRMDMSYIRDRSIFQDLKLLAQTVPAVVARRGAS